MPNTFEDLKKSIVDVVESRAKDFLKENADAKVFLVERAERLAKIAFEYATAPDDKKDALKADMEVVRQSIENEISSVAVAASKSSRELFKAILGTALDVLVKALPTIIAAI